MKIETNEVERTLEITDTFITGDRAMLTVRTGQGSSPYTEDLFVFMRFEEGEWRLDEFGRAERHSLQQLISERFVPSWSTEAGAQATVQQLIFALATYAQTFPAIGFPYQLDALACVEPTISQDVEPASHNTQAATDAVSNDITSENATDEEAAPPSQSEASPDHACLLPPHFVSTRLQNSGYQLQYTPIDRTAYQIVATPIRYGDTGMKSFFADQTGVIHFTTDDRPATAQDEVAPTSRRALID